MFEGPQCAAVGLLTRLERENRVTPWGTLRHHAGGAKEHRHVKVVPAGVHGAGTFGSEVHTTVLRDRKRVHVGA